MLSSLLVAACSQNGNQNDSLNLDTPEVVIKAVSNEKSWLLNNQEIDPHDPQHTVAGAWLSTNSFANHQCFNYQPDAQQITVAGQLGVSFTNSEFAKSFGATTSLRVGLLGVGHNLKLLNTYLSAQTGKYNLNVTYKATISTKVINNFQGLNDAGKFYAKQGIESFTVNCGSHFVNSYNGTLGGLMLLTISSTNLDSLQTLEQTLENMPVSFLGVIGKIKQLQQTASNGISYNLNFAPYGGTQADQAKLNSLLIILESSPNLQICLNKLDTSAGGSCNQFIQNDVESAFLGGVATIFESEIKNNDFSGVVADDYNQRTVTSLYGSQVGFSKVGILPDPYAKFPLESQFLLALDLTLAAQLESNQATIVKNLYPNSTDININNAASGMTANANIYASQANLVWQQLRQCLVNYSCSTTVSNPAALLQAYSGALNNFYYLAYNVQQNFNLLNSTPPLQVRIPGFLYSDGAKTVVIAKQMVANSDVIHNFSGPLYELYNIPTIVQLNSRLRNNSVISAYVNFGALPFMSTMRINNFNFDINQNAILACNLTTLNTSCLASIMTPYTNSENNTFANGGLFIATENPFYSLPNPS